MNTRHRSAFLLFSLLVPAGCVSRRASPAQADGVQSAVDRRALADTVVGQWSNVSSLAARRMIEEYGVPDEVHYGRIVWNNNGPWKRTVVRDIRPAYVEGDELGVVEQAVEYTLAPVQEKALTPFAKKASYNARTGELASKSDREELNFLTLNLIDDVAKGVQAPAQARDSYVRLQSLEEAGKSSDYLTGLRFKRPAP